MSETAISDVLVYLIIYIKFRSMTPQDSRRPNPQENSDAWQRTGGEFVSGPPPEKPSTPEKP